MTQSVEDRIRQEQLEQRLRAAVVTGQSSLVEKAFNEAVLDRIDKAEGSRGGKIIGHTRSGKPIYDTANHPSHSDFSSKEHYEAGQLNEQNKNEENASKHYSAAENKKEEEKDSKYSKNPKVRGMI